MISTKGRYSIRILLDLAEHRSGGYIPMKEVAARQNISLKYIEKLMPALKTAGFIESVHGIGGGYRLTLCRDGERVTKFACVDGPDFDGYEVDFDEAMSRGRMYMPFERHAYEATCNLFAKEAE